MNTTIAVQLGFKNNMGRVIFKFISKLYASAFPVLGCNAQHPRLEERLNLTQLCSGFSPWSAGSQTRASSCCKRVVEQSCLTRGSQEARYGGSARKGGSRDPTDPRPHLHHSVDTNPGALPGLRQSPSQAG